MGDSCEALLICCACATICIQCGMLSEYCSGSKTSNAQNANVTVVTQQPPFNHVQHQPPFNQVQHQPPFYPVQHQPPFNQVQHPPPLNRVQHQLPPNQPTAPPRDYFQTITEPPYVREATTVDYREAPPSYDESMRMDRVVRPQ